MQTAAKHRLLFFVVTLLIVAGAYAFAHANSGWYKMPNAAMEPTLKTGEVFFQVETLIASAQLRLDEH